MKGLIALAALLFLASSEAQVFDNIREGSAEMIRKLKGGAAEFSRRRRNQFGAPGLANNWDGEAILFVPGHTLKATSWMPAARYAFTRRSNGQFAAVYSGKDRKFHRNGGNGDILSDSHAGATRIYIVDFSDVFASAEVKARQIADCIQAIKRVKRAVDRRLIMSIVTHSAGDADFDTAASRSFITPDDIQILNRVAVGPVYDGTVMGNLGKATLGRLGRLGEFFGATAARELAEGSPTIRRLRAAQPSLNRGIYRGTERVDILSDGIGDLTARLQGGKKLFGPGDGFVQSTQRRPFVGRTVVVHCVDPTPLNHLRQVQYGGVLIKIDEVLKN